MFGSENFNISLKELKDYLNFELTTTNDDLSGIIVKKYDVLLIHEDYLKDLTQFKKDLLKKINQLKVLATHSLKKYIKHFFKQIISTNLYKRS